MGAPRAGRGQLEDERQPPRPTRGCSTAVLDARPYGCDVAVCVPFPYLPETAAALAGSDLRWGAQDCSAHDARAPTPARCRRRCWPSSAAAMRSSGTPERRALHGESDAARGRQGACRAGAAASRPSSAWARRSSEREAGQTEAVVKRQLSAVIHTLAHCAGEMRRRLRAGVGDRHRADGHARAGAGGARGAARAARAPPRRARRDDAALRRQRQARQRRARSSRSPTSTAD
jgi:hypothetical protein